MQDDLIEFRRELAETDPSLLEHFLPPSANRALLIMGVVFGNVATEDLQ